MRWATLLLALQCLLGLVDCVRSLSTCSTLDLELIKRKRIEAIRGQILSKLQLSQEPEVDQDVETESVPAEVISVYNSTVELSNDLMVDTQGTTVEEHTEEEYYAKEVHKFTMKLTPDEDNQNKLLLFNITEIKQLLGSERLLSQAELRLRIKDPRIAPGSEQRLELYQHSADKSRYLGSRFVSNELADKWLSFDVTETLKNWLQQTEETQKFQVKLNCGCEKPQETFHFNIAGLANKRGDTAALAGQVQRPHILVMSLPAERHSHLKSRSKRETETDAVCSGKAEECCVRSLYIDFRKDLGWKWIHEPSGYTANYCSGSCSYVWTPENKYSQVLFLYKNHNPGASAQPCCVPQALDPLTILYYVGRQHKVEQLSNMIVKTCKCC